MNLNDFEAYIDSVILMRGLSYYNSGTIASLDYEDGEWVAEVMGSDDYTVRVSLSQDGEIRDTECDCPYVFGEFCKHQAAVFFALRAQREHGEPPGETAVKSLEALLKNLKKQTLMSIVLEFAGKDRRMREELFLRYGEKAYSLESARRVIRAAIDAVVRRGIVEYRDVERALKGAHTVMHMIDEQMVSGNTLPALRLCIVALEEMMNLHEYCDDSDGYLGEHIGGTIGKVSEALRAMPPDHRDAEAVFGIVFDHAQNDVYEDWTDWRLELLSALIPLCGNRVCREKIAQYITDRCDAQADGWSVRYQNHQLQKLMHSIIAEFDGEAAAAVYMERHLDNDDFRRAVIHTAISAGQYGRALDLCLEGERSDKEYAGLRSEWKGLRYDIYVKTGDAKAQKTLGMELLLGGDFEYYTNLKALYTDEEWPTVLEGILGKLGSGHRGDVYVKILIHEGLTQRLLAYCRGNAHSIVEHYKHLLPECKNDVGLIFAKYISEKAARAGTRKHYAEVCVIIRHFRKACGGKAAHAIRDELAAKYAKRPAFLDELRRV